MTKDEFGKIIKPLFDIKLPISDAALNVYYVQLKDVETKDLERTVKELINTYKNGWFPSIADFKEVISQFQESKINVPPLGFAKCKKCGDTGIILKEVTWYGHPYTRASFCDCEKGEEKERAWNNYKDSGSEEV